MVRSNRSGYGASWVPVLSSNNYDLEEGEVSVYQRELSNRGDKPNSGSPKEKTVKKKADFCLVCLDDRGKHKMVSCSLCPCSFHSKCIHFPLVSGMGCPHHRCRTCGKNSSAAGGILFPCSMCPNSFCEGCLPTTGVRHIESNQRWSELGYRPNHMSYIHCSDVCEQYAVEQFGWTTENLIQTIPEPLDLENHFDGDVVDKTGDEKKEAALKTPDQGPQMFPHVNTRPDARDECPHKADTNPSAMINLTETMPPPKTSEETRIVCALSVEI
jgi:hypothetical protein